MSIISFQPTNYVFCGLFGVSDDFPEQTQSLDQRFIRNKASTFFLLASGDSMIPTIYPDEILIVDRSIQNFHKRVCIVAHEGELLCKRLWVDSQKIYLKSDNPKYKDIIVHEELESLVWGVVIGKAADVI